jgi:hypothetical protein
VSPITDPTPADRVYKRLEPIAHGDEDTGYMLYGLVEALTLPQDPLEEIVREDDTHPAWTRAVDPYEVPLWALPWLANLVGVEWAGASSEALRTKTIERPNYRRGTVPAIRSAAQTTLTGTKTVFVGARDGGSPWRMSIGTLATETPNPAWTLAAILSEKPAGTILEALVDLADWTYLAIWASYQDIAEVDATFATYTDLTAGP